MDVWTILIIVIVELIGLYFFRLKGLIFFNIAILVGYIIGKLL